MANLFPDGSDALLRVGLVCVFLAGAALVLVPTIYVRTPFHTHQLFPVGQPVEFDHRHHVQDDGIDCRYCHNQVERAPMAGLPSASTCMGCHGQIWQQSPMLEPVRRSYFSGMPIPWKLVTDIPGYVYFNHAVHVNKGIGCEECHGRVDQMARVYKAFPMNMEWCLSCHRSPEKHLRPLSEITTMGWKPLPGDARALQAQLAKRYHVERLTDCTVCHR